MDRIAEACGRMDLTPAMEIVMEWILVMCTSGWIMCGQERVITYPNEAACYRALDDLYKRNKPDAFKYVICKPKALNKTANG